MNNNYKIAIGMMSGTSIDGIDACLVKLYDDYNYEFLDTHSIEYPIEVRKNLIKLANNNGSTADVCNMNFVVGKLFANCANQLINKSGYNKNKIDFIASHGQTVFHIPQNITTGGITTRSTLQIGNISVISELTGIKTIGDFRSKDIAAGGQGAPLVPFADELIFKKDIPRAIQNIGGIGNVTVLSPNCETFAFDTGPGNMLIDVCMKKLYSKDYDENGEIAAKGNVNKALLRELLEEPYYKAQPPKSTGRELYNDNYINTKILSKNINKQDIITTVTFLTAKTIALAYENYIFPKTQIQEMVIGGGGAYNKTLLKFIKDCLPQITLKKHSDFGINNKYKEALAFAMLGLCTINFVPNNIESCTGAKKRVIMGNISY